MKNLTPILLILIFSFNSALAQLFVKDAYVYVADKSIYVGQDINLSTVNSNIFLRNDSQILQGLATASSTNVGLGTVSLYQEGSSNGFAYNYWCSPVGVATSTTGNSNFGITQLGAPTSSTNTTFTAPGPAVGFATGLTTNGTLQIAQRWIYTYISGLNYSNWNFIGNAATIPPGYGFTMKGNSGTDNTTGITVSAASSTNNNPGGAQRYDFRGKPNNGTFTATVDVGKLTLVGNPYPSAIDMNVFLSPVENPNCDGTAQYWEQPNAGSTSHVLATYQGGYGVYVASTSTYIPAAIKGYNPDGSVDLTVTPATGTTFARRFAPVGQGFMVTGVTGTGVVTFKNAHRVEVKEGFVNNSQFARNSSGSNSQNTFYPNYPAIPNVAGRDYTRESTAPVPQIRINALLNNSARRQIALVFLPGASDGYDRADGKSPDTGGSSLPIDMYLAMNNTEFVQSCKAFEISKTFQLGFKNNTPATFRLQVDEIVNFRGSNDVYLHDKVTDKYFDIKNASYQISIPAGVNNTRYEITFQTNNLSTPTTSILSTLNVFHNDVNKTVTVKNPKNINLKSCSLFDISGKTIFSKNKLGSDVLYEFSSSSLSDGVYIVKLISEDGEETSKKITVFNTK